MGEMILRDEKGTVLFASLVYEGNERFCYIEALASLRGSPLILHLENFGLILEGDYLIVIEAIKFHKPNFTTRVL